MDVTQSEGLALLGRRARHRLGRLRPRGREPERARPPAARGADGHRRGDVEAGAKDKSIRGLVILSGKEKGFIVGADVREFEQFRTEAEVIAAITPVLAMLDRIEAMPVPVVCGIHGFCLGGGLELALACHWRIATRDDATRLGFPEVKLGIFPGFNGTWRSIRQAGAAGGHGADALGRMERSAAARAMGLVDELVAGPQNLAWAARKAIERKRRSRPAGRFAGMMRFWPGRKLVISKMLRRSCQRRRARSTTPRLTG